MNMTLRQSIIATIITFLLIAVAMSLAGCTNRFRNETALYWPWENGDDIYKSREAENEWGVGTLRR